MSVLESESCSTTSATPLVSLAAVFSIVTQRSSPQKVCGEERCVTMLKTAARETTTSQAGKDVCDRRIATFKSHMRGVINEGNDKNTTKT